MSQVNFSSNEDEELKMSLAHYHYVADTTIGNFCGPTGIHASDYSFNIDKFLMKRVIRDLQ